MEFLKVLIKVIIYGITAWFMHNDSKNRDTTGILWIIAAFFLCFFGFFSWSAFIVYPLFLILYFVLRPKGELVYCTECFKKKLIDKPYCPHCFHIDESVIEEEFEDDDENEELEDNSDDDETNENSDDSESDDKEKKKNSQESEQTEENNSDNSENKSDQDSEENSDNKDDNKNSLA